MEDDEDEEKLKGKQKNPRLESALLRCLKHV